MVTYHVLLVDDEKIERTSLLLLLQKHGFDVHTAEAANGREALEYMNTHPVDIVITDIRMPIMNGIDLVMAVAQRHPAVQMVIYSAYSEFEYARKAIQAGVSQYLLKPVQVPEFVQVMKECITRCQKQAQQAENEKLWTQVARKFQNYQKQQYLQLLLREGGAAGSYEEALAWMRDRLGGHLVYLVLLQTHAAFFEHSEQALLTECLDLLGDSFEYLSITEYEGLLFLYSEEEISPAQLRKTGERLASAVAKHDEQAFFCFFSHPVAEAGQIHAAYRELDSLGDYAFFLQESCVFVQGDEVTLTGSSTLLDGTLVNSIYEKARYGDFASLHEDIAMLARVAQATAGLSQLYIKNMFSTMFQILHEYAPNILEGRLNPVLKEIMRMTNIEDLTQYVKTQLEELQALDGNAGVNSSAVKQALKIIHQEYSNDQLNTEYLAQRVYLSANYLGSLFKKDVGLSVKKYITRCRLDKAAEMLVATNGKIADIGKAVGFSSDTYFVTVFGSQYGLSPARYREQHWKAGQRHEE